MNEVKKIKKEHSEMKLNVVYLKEQDDEKNELN